MDTNEFLTHSQIVDLIKAVGHKRTVLIMGENGTGKSWLHRTLSADPFFADHIKPAPIDCTQLSDGSLFMPDIDRERGVSTELPNERLGVSRSNQRGVNGSKPVLVMFDEIAKVPQYVKNMIAPMLYDRRVGTFYMPEGSMVFAATNLAVEGLGDTLQAHLRNRQIVVKMRKATGDSGAATGPNFSSAFTTLEYLDLSVFTRKSTGARSAKAAPCSAAFAPNTRSKDALSHSG